MGITDASSAKLGTLTARRMYIGENEVWGNYLSISYILSDVTTNGVNQVMIGDPFTATLTATSGKQLNTNSVVVTMGGVDITSTTYNSTTNTITIASVTSNVTITAAAVEVIVFEDNAVKAICVANWGGSVISGEITTDEAALVTSLEGVFRNNTDITKFNELQYFTSLTSLYVTGTGDSIYGDFANCSNLTEITIPAAPIRDFRGAFRYAGIANLDISPTTASTFRMDAMTQGSASGTTALRTVKLPGIPCTNIVRGVRRSRGLTTIIIDGTLDLSSVSEYTSCFESDTALTTITGAMSGIKANINIASSPLTVESALVILNGLDDVSGKRITFKASQQAIFEANADFQTALARVVGYGWTIAYA